jgi:tight adherence protein C
MFLAVSATTLSWVGFVMVSCLVLLVFTLVAGRKNRIDDRLRELSGRGGPAPEPEGDMMGQLVKQTAAWGQKLVPVDDEQRTRLQARLIHAGLYSRQAMAVFLGTKLLLTIGPAVIGLLAGFLGLISISAGFIVGALFGIFGMIGPSFWLDMRKSARQTSIRRALPDALDVLVICLEGGLSLPAAFKRVANELRTAHPLLAEELSIAQREIQLGRSTGEALRQFGERTDLEEVRSLASVITQSERFGASLVRALRVHAETLRTKRLQYAEEMAQKAAVKILFPTLLCIFPGIFVVLLGPAVIQIIGMFRTLGQ